MKRLFALALTLMAGFLSAANAQYKAFEMGNVPMADLEMVKYPGDSTAHSVTLFHYGRTRFVGKGNGLQLFTRVHKVIKVIDTEGSGRANVVVPLYSMESSQEGIQSVEAYTYWLDGGAMKKAKLGNDGIFYEKVSENLTYAKFTLPAVKPGCVMEFVYAKTSDFSYGLQTWSFQEVYPVRESHFNVVIPAWFTYKAIQTGYFPYVQQSSTEIEETYHLLNSPEVTVAAISHYWHMKDLPAFKAEPFMTSANDYKSQIRFELTAYQMPGQGPVDVGRTWPVFASEMMDNEKLGRRLRQVKGLPPLPAGVVRQGMTQTQTAETIYGYLQTKVNWTGEYSPYSDREPAVVAEAGRGTSGEINMLLICRLREAGIIADPVLLSTRDNGRVSQDMPVRTEFNHLVAVADLEGKSVLMDLSHSSLPMGELSFDCMNGVGVRLKEKSATFIPLRTQEMLLESATASLQLLPDGTLEGSYDRSLASLSAGDARQQASDKSEPVSLDNWTVNCQPQEHLDELSEKVTQNCTVSTKLNTLTAGGRMYVTPLKGLLTTGNPFSEKERAYPIDLGCPLKEVVKVALNVPEGWVVEELPEQTVVGIPENGGKFRFTAFQEGNVVTLISSISLDQTYYSPHFYQGIREMFDIALAKQDEPIILRKP